MKRRDFIKRMAATAMVSIAALCAGFFCARAADAAGPAKAEPNDRRPVLFIIGDSTVKNGTRGQKGWGEVIGDFFDPNRIKVENHAIGGRSSRTFLTEGRWDRVLAGLKPGDFVLMQFGHNDNGALNDTSRARGTIKGAGDEQQEIENLLTGRHEVVRSYGWYLRKYLADTKAKGATPIICSLVPRKIWRDGKIVRSNDYAKWAAEVARAEKVGFIDLNEMIARRYDELGPEKVEPLFGDPHTHTSPAGAELNAECVVAGLKQIENCPLRDFLAAKPVKIAAPAGDGQAPNR